MTLSIGLAAGTVGLTCGHFSKGRLEFMSGMLFITSCMSSKMTIDFDALLLL